MKELEQDADVSLDVQFGSISFVQNNNAPFASISVLVTFPDGDHHEGRDSVRLDIGFPADPAIDTIMSVVEKSRLAVIKRLTEAAMFLEATTSSELLFGEAREPT